jgi:hypothetical protein
MPSLATLEDVRQHNLELLAHFRQLRVCRDALKAAHADQREIDEIRKQMILLLAKVIDGTSVVIRAYIPQGGVQ